MYRLYRLGNRVEIAVVPKLEARLLEHLMKESEYGKFRDIVEYLEFTAIAPGENLDEWYQFITSASKVLAELDDDRGYYILVEV
jgi:hypothetical protein